jgi:hypothetical protein
MKPDKSMRQLVVTCHCGAVRISVPAMPESIVECNCSICRRNGALWAFYSADTVQIVGHPEHTTQYIWGARSIRTMHCKTCGCATHWETIDGGPTDRVGVNSRLLDLELLKGIRIRHFDGADSWTYID